MNTFGKMIRLARQKLGFKLREFCEKHGYDPGSWSRIENGKWVPSGLGLDAVLKDLRIHHSKKDYYMDAASASRGEIPPDLMQNEEFVEYLPTLFAAVRKNGMKVFNGE